MTRKAALTGTQLNVRLESGGEVVQQVNAEINLPNLLATVFAPIVEIIPNEAAVPALVLVGFLMMQQVKNIEWDDVEIAIPAFLTIVLMPFTYSISVGIGAGFLAYVLVKIVRGKASAIHPLMWVVSALFVLYFAIEPVKQVLGA